jgi:hypothetical protein
MKSDQIVSGLSLQQGFSESPKLMVTGFQTYLMKEHHFSSMFGLEPFFGG